MEKKLYSAAEVSKDTSAAFFLKLFDKGDLLVRLNVMYGFTDADNLPKQELAERWLRMLSAGRLKELADKVVGQLMQFDEFNDDVTDAIDDTLLDAVTKNAGEICTTRPDGMVGYLFPWLKGNDRIDNDTLQKAGFSPGITGHQAEDKKPLKWDLNLFLDTPVGRFSYCRIRLEINDTFVNDPYYNVDVDFEHPAAALRKRFDNKIVGARYKRAAHGVFWSGWGKHSIREAFDTVSDRFMQKREEILGIIREISPEEFV